MVPSFCVLFEGRSCQVQENREPEWDESAAEQRGRPVSYLKSQSLFCESFWGCALGSARCCLRRSGERWFGSSSSSSLAPQPSCMPSVTGAAGLWARVCPSAICRGRCLKLLVLYSSPAGGCAWKPVAVKPPAQPGVNTAQSHARSLVLECFLLPTQVPSKNSSFRSFTFQGSLR
jgi:hypothetical protein